MATITPLFTGQFAVIDDSAAGSALLNASGALNSSGVTDSSGILRSSAPAALPEVFTPATPSSTVQISPLGQLLSVSTPAQIQTGLLNAQNGDSAALLLSRIDALTAPSPFASTAVPPPAPSLPAPPLPAPPGNSVAPMDPHTAAAIAAYRLGNGVFDPAINEGTEPAPAFSEAVPAIREIDAIPAELGRRFMNNAWNGAATSGTLSAMA
ncbi:MAG: hypothetical protein V4443_05200 [Pseudomonadota bacterium]